MSGMTPGGSVGDIGVHRAATRPTEATFISKATDGKASEIELLPTAKPRGIRKSWRKNRLRAARYMICYFFR